jgi:hypothetical protein
MFRTGVSVAHGRKTGAQCQGTSTYLLYEISPTHVFTLRYFLIALLISKIIFTTEGSGDHGEKKRYLKGLRVVGMQCSRGLWPCASL